MAVAARGRFIHPRVAGTGRQLGGSQNVAAEVEQDELHGAEASSGEGNPGAGIERIRVVCAKAGKEWPRADSSCSVMAVGRSCLSP